MRRGGGSGAEPSRKEAEFGCSTAKRDEPPFSAHRNAEERCKRFSCSFHFVYQSIQAQSTLCSSVACWRASQNEVDDRPRRRGWTELGERLPLPVKSSRRRAALGLRALIASRHKVVLRWPASALVHLVAPFLPPLFPSAARRSFRSFFQLSQSLQSLRRQLVTQQQLSSPTTLVFPGHRQPAANGTSFAQEGSLPGASSHLGSSSFYQRTQRPYHRLQPQAAATATAVLGHQLSLPAPRL